MAYFCHLFGTQVGGVLLFSEASQRHIACVLGAGWPQDEANSWKKLTVSFSRVSEEMLAARYGKQLEKAENYQFL